MRGLAHDGQLMSFEHRGFWQPMDTLRDREYAGRRYGTGGQHRGRSGEASRAVAFWEGRTVLLTGQTGFKGGAGPRGMLAAPPARRVTAVALDPEPGPGALQRCCARGGIFRRTCGAGSCRNDAMAGVTLPEGGAVPAHWRPTHRVPRGFRDPVRTWSSNVARATMTVFAGPARNHARRRAVMLDVGTRSYRDARTGSALGGLTPWADGDPMRPQGGLRGGSWPAGDSAFEYHSRPWRRHRLGNVIRRR